MQITFTGDEATFVTDRPHRVGSPAVNKTGKALVSGTAHERYQTRWENDPASRAYVAARRMGAWSITEYDVLEYVAKHRGMVHDPSSHSATLSARLS